MKQHWVDFDSLKDGIHRKIADHRDNRKPEKLYNDLSIDYLLKAIDKELKPVLSAINLWEYNFWKSELEAVCEMVKEFKI